MAKIMAKVATLPTFEVTCPYCDVVIESETGSQVWEGGEHNPTTVKCQSCARFSYLPAKLRKPRKF